MIFFFSFPATGSLEFRDFWVFSFFRFFLFFFCVFSVSFVFFSRNSRVSQVSRGYGGRLRSPPQLADASLKRATDVAQTNEKSCFHIQKQLEPFFFFLSFSFLLYPIYRACYLFQISPPCLSMSPEVSFSRMFIWSSNKDF